MKRDPDEIYDNWKDNHWEDCEMKIGIKPTERITVDAKTLKLHLKVRDCCSFTIEDAEGNELTQHDDYVPGFFPGDPHGDYIILDIDLNTMQVTNWTLKPDDLQEFIDENRGEE